MMGLNEKQWEEYFIAKGVGHADLFFSISPCPACHNEIIYSCLKRSEFQCPHCRGFLQPIERGEKDGS